MKPNTVICPDSGRIIPKAYARVAHDEIGIALNSLARGQMRARLLADIALDLMVCEMEGLDPRDYIKELREMIADIEAQIDAATAKWGQE